MQGDKRNMSESKIETQDTQDFGKLIREGRKNTGLSLSEAAKSLGVVAVYLDALERRQERKVPDEDTLWQMAELYRITPSTLFAAYGMIPAEVVGYLCHTAPERLQAAFEAMGRDTLTATDAPDDSSTTEEA